MNKTENEKPPILIPVSVKDELPKENGYYVIQFKDGKIGYENYNGVDWQVCGYSAKVVSWYKQQSTSSAELEKEEDLRLKAIEALDVNTYGRLDYFDLINIMVQFATNNPRVIITQPTIDMIEAVVTSDEDWIREKCKRVVAYDRQFAVCGKKEADGVLYFAMKGYELAIEDMKQRLSSLQQQNTTSLDKESLWNKFHFDDGLGHQLIDKDNFNKLIDYLAKNTTEAAAAKEVGQCHNCIYDKHCTMQDIGIIEKNCSKKESK